MLTLDLQQDFLLLIQNILKRFVPNEIVWAYGSRVNGTSHAASDLDLVIRNHADLNTPCLQLTQLKQAFQDSDLPFLVDLVDWAWLPESYKAEINKQYVVIL
jgi:predicted nucleotidyltransferase